MINCYRNNCRAKISTHSSPTIPAMSCLTVLGLPRVAMASQLTGPVYTGVNDTAGDS